MCQFHPRWRRFRLGFVHTFNTEPIFEWEIAMLFIHPWVDKMVLVSMIFQMQGCALTKIEGSPVLWTCEIQGAQHMISMKKLKFSSRPRTKVRRQGPPGSARVQPWNVATVTRVFSGISFPYTSICGSVAELSARRTRNPVVPSSSPALATCWICSQSSRIHILSLACK